MTDRKLRVFLCHASQDKPVVRELYKRLLAEGWIDPWLDEEKLLPGHDWDLEIEKAVESSDVVLLFLSSHSVSREGYVQKEIRFALNMALFKPAETIFIIPLRLDNCLVPRNLNSIQYIDYFPPNRITWAYDRLRESMSLRLKQTIARENLDLETVNYSQELDQLENKSDPLTEKSINKRNDAKKPVRKKRSKKSSSELSLSQSSQEKINPERTMNLLRSAQVNLNNGDLTDALENYNALAQKGVYLGIIVATLEEIIRDYPDNSLAWETLGYAYKGLNQEDKSRRAFNNALSTLKSA
jgi:hypothetical protein